MYVYFYRDEDPSYVPDDTDTSKSEDDLDATFSNHIQSLPEADITLCPIIKNPEHLREQGPVHLVYEEQLKELANLTPPQRCTHVNCNRPYQVHVGQRGTATHISWVSNILN